MAEYGGGVSVNAGTLTIALSAVHRQHGWDQGRCH